MRGNILNKLLILFGILSIIACKPKKQVIAAKKADVVAVNPVMENKLNSIKAAQLHFNTFSGRAKTQLTIGNSTNNVTMNIRIAKGQKIWVSITAIAGIEVARALITHDSILVINKLQGLYVKKPFSYINAYVGDQLDYSSVEALFVGNAIPQLLNENAHMQPDSGNVDLTGSLNDLIYQMVVGPDLKVKTTHIANQAEGQSAHINNGAFIPSGNRIIPSQIDISSAVNAKKVKISMHYIKVDFDLPLEYPFSIPESYSEGH
ncbi:MAG: DUF4292 domain-containing protein [Sphingobacteriales bacterium]